jgi:vancomycin resistance protein VanJ
MKLVRTILEATAIEACVAVFLLAALGFSGAWNGWLDLLNCGALLFLIAALASAAFGRMILPAGMTRRVCVWLALAAFAFYAALIGPDLVGVATQFKAVGAPAYHLVSANVFENNGSPAEAIADIRNRAADAVLMQETDGTAAAAGRLLDQTYRYSTHCVNASVRIWVKTPILNQGCGLGLPGQTLDQAFVWLRISGPDGRPITLATVHLARPYPPGKQAIERAKLAQALARLPKDELILTGDFNTPAWSFAMKDQDRLLRPLRRRTLLWLSWPARLNYLDKPFSWPVLPIDHIYTGSAWTGITLKRFRTPGSDHFGTEAYVALHR